MRWLRFGLPVLGLVAVAAGFGVENREDGLMSGLVSLADPITVTASDFKFDAPAKITGGVVTFRMINAGKQWHHATIFKLDEGKTSKDLLAALSKPGPLPAWATPMGGPNGVDPGRTAVATVALRPGNYAWFCFIPDMDKAPHFAKGMTMDFEVVGPTSSMTLPPAAISVQLMDYEFKLSAAPKAGRQVWRVRNYASQPHELELIKLAPGKTLNDLKEWLKTEAGPPPGKGLGGVSFLGSNTANNMEVELTPGEYALLCFVPDVKDGAPHFVHGMVQGFTVK